MAILHDRIGKKSLALREYERLIKEFPDADDIQIDSLYGAAVIYDTLKKHEKAQDYYKTIIDRYGKRRDSNYPMIVRDARIRYQMTRRK
jgi:TolA-binding protein